MSAGDAPAAPAAADRFQTLFEQAPFSVQLLALDGTTLRVNAAWEALWQGSREHVLHGYNVFADPQLEASGVTAQLRRAFAGEAVTLEPVEYDPARLGKPGRARWVRAHAHPIRDAGGAVREVMLIHEDVTEHIESERELRASIEQLRQAESELRDADRRKDEFLAMLAHELRNPLAPIVTAAELLRLDPGGADAREMNEVIARQAGHLSKLLDELLDASRVTRGRVTLDLAVLDLASVVAAAIEQVRPRISEREHVLTTRNDAGHVWVRGDRTRLTQIAANLLDNAAKFTPRAGNISVVLSQSDGQATLTVRDNGEGIDAALLPRVFDLFTQASRPADRSLGGLGLGLALARSLARMHGGDIQAFSLGAGAGARFVVSLPLAPVTTTPHAEPPTPAAGAGRSILIVDDNLDAARTTATLLRLQGHQVRTAADGAEALALSGAHWPEVFILDIGLPGMDGYALCQALRREAGGRRTTFIALTGYGQDQDVMRSREAGFDHHLIKPADPARLAQLLA